MGKPVVYGADYSVYVRIVRLVLEEKGVGYELVPVDIFAADGIPGWYFEHQPFGRIPAFEHDGFRLYETGAIARYVDEAFGGPALQPVKAEGPWLLGTDLTLADLHAAPIIGYFVKVAEGQALLAEFAEIRDWYARITQRASFAKTEKAG